jgi:predicted Fe-Mo cluster-binding NifX family protein
MWCTYLYIYYITNGTIKNFLTKHNKFSHLNHDKSLALNLSIAEHDVSHFITENVPFIFQLLDPAWLKWVEMNCK